MTSQPIRDPLAEHLITPENSAFLLIDWQPSQVSTVSSMDRDLLLRNAVSTPRIVKTWDDIEFVDAVRATGRRKLIFCALGNVVFGTDYPYPRDAISIGGLHQLQNTTEFDDRERRGVLGGSAARHILRLARVESTV